jgi:hypothetical protein
MRRRLFLDRARLPGQFQSMQSEYRVEKRAGSKNSNRPDGQGLKSCKLTLIMGVAVPGWIAWFGWGLEFDKGARRLTGTFQSNVGPSHPWRPQLHSS